jgi:hypothetical protein
LSPIPAKRRPPVDSQRMPASFASSTRMSLGP